MSLLLDALKRAEQEKLARQGAQPGGPTPAPAAPAVAGASAHKPSFELEAIEAPASSTRAPGAAHPGAPGERSAAQTLFTAKREERAPQSSGKTPLIVVGVAALVLLAAGGGYVWYELQSLSSPQRPMAGVRPVTPAPAQIPGTKPADAQPPPLAMLVPAVAPPEAKKARPAPQAAQQLVMDLLRESANAPAAPPLKLTRSMDPPPVLADVAAGYEALKRGDAATALRRYRAALVTDRANLDALLGLATAEARTGGRNDAVRHYRRALEVDPRNAVALAGLASLADFSRPQALETQLRADLQRNPQSAALHFTLGNLLASQSRWADAQAAYFEAHRLDAGNPDIAHNLAVSLDQLGQVRLAAQYYDRALAQARGHGAQFDTRVAEKRLAELRP